MIKIVDVSIEETAIYLSLKIEKHFLSIKKDQLH